MDENNEQNQNVGEPTGGEPTAADPGNVGVDPSAGDRPDGSGGTPTANQGNEDIDKYKQEVRRLNRALVEAKRNGKNQDQGNNQYTSEVLNTPEGQYAASIEIADARLRSGLEERLSLYPEISDEDKARIRTNPWAFANRQSFFSGDHEQALDEIELMLVDKVEASGSNTPANNQPGNQNPQGNDNRQPARVSGNPAPEPTNPEGAVPGSEEDQDPWTMPLDQLEQLAEKQFKKLQAQ